MSLDSDINAFSTIEEFDSFEAIKLPDVNRMQEEHWEALFNYVDESTFTVVIDFEATPLLPTTAMKKLLEFKLREKNHDHHVAICGFPQVTLGVMGSLQIDQAYRVFESRSQALTHYLSQSEARFAVDTCGHATLRLGEVFNPSHGYYRQTRKLRIDSNDGNRPIVEVSV